MKKTSEVSLYSIFSPVSIVLDSYRYASRWRAIREAWRASALGYRCLCGVLVGAFVGLGLLSIFFDNYWYFYASAICTVLASIVFRQKIIDRYEPVGASERFERYFGLNYRFRRYLLFREQLELMEVTRETMQGACLGLSKQRKLLEGRPTAFGAGGTALLSIVISMLTTLSTRDSLIESGWTFIIMFSCLIVLFFYSIVRSGFLTEKERHVELECFVEWYEEELKFAVEPSPGSVN